MLSSGSRMSGTGVMLGMDRRRAGSLGIEERALTTLEKFVELCDNGYADDDEVDEVTGNVLDSLDSLAEAPPKSDKGGRDTSSGGGGGGLRFGKSIFSSHPLYTKTVPSLPVSNTQQRTKLCELFIDRSLVEMKTKSTSQELKKSSSNKNGTSSGRTSPSTQKKSEEIWVKRVTDPARRSFRTFRGQQLPSILTEDVDETNEGSVNSSGTTTNSKMPVTNAATDNDSRTRHRSGGDDAVIRSSTGTKTNAILDAFRPRSKSDVARLKKPTFMSTMKTAVQNSLLSASSSSSSGTSESQKNQNSSANSSGHRPRSGSESLRSPVSKVMDMFRNRSHSVNASDDKRHRHKHGSSNSWTPAGARRSSLHSHRPSDVSLDPAHAAILFRDSRGLPVADPFLERILNLSEEEENEILVKFFKFHKCYDLIPTSAKLVVFDTQLLVKKAFFALVYNGVRAAPLWDSTEREFVGMLTITDFIRVLHAMYNDSAGRMSELEEHRVETWRRRFLQDKQPLISIDPDASLYDAICSLVNNRIHRLPVIDKHTGNVLHILTHKRILKFLFLYINEIPRPSFLNKRLREVKIGTFDNVETAREDTPIIQALQKFLDRRVSALPIVDVENRLLDIYARFDVINLAAEKTYNNLDITLKQANEHRNEWFEGVHKCTLDDTLFVIMEKIVKAEVHRLVVVDEQDRVIGVISLSDILQYLVMRPELKEVDDKKVQEIHDTIRREKADAEAASANRDNSQLQRHESEETGERENPTINEEEEDEKT